MFILHPPHLLIRFVARVIRFYFFSPKKYLTSTPLIIESYVLTKMMTDGMINSVAEQGCGEQELHRGSGGGAAEVAEDHIGSGRGTPQAEEGARPSHLGARHPGNAARQEKRRTGAPLRENQDTAIHAQQGGDSVQVCLPMDGAMDIQSFFCIPMR